MKDHGEGGNIIGADPRGKVLIIDDVLSAGSAGRESINSIINHNATPSSFVVGLDRQEKGVSNQSASKELESEFNLNVTSIVDLDSLIGYVKNESELTEHLEGLNNYRNTWGA